MDTLLLALFDRLIDGRVNDLLVHGVLLGDGVGDEHAALHAQLLLRLEHRGKLRHIEFVVRSL